MKKTGYDMLYLTACAVNGISPETERAASMDMGKLYRMSNFHSLTAIVCMALESAGLGVEQKWTENKAEAVRKNLLLDAERAKICGFMEQNGIWYMPLKGVILKELYPKLGMRQMADNDILYDRKFQQQLADYMKKCGYIAESVGRSHHDIFMKKPVYNFEMHTDLFGESSGFHAYYSDVKNRLIKDDNNKFGYHFTDSDFYIYMTSHEYKHYSEGGTGLRSLLDCYVYTRAKNDLDWNYIGAELAKLGISDFERISRGLAEKIFSEPDLVRLSDEETKMLEYCLFSGTYGTVRNVVDNSRKKLGSNGKTASKWKYIYRRLFPGIEFYKERYPFFYRHKLLLPAAWLHRLARAVKINRKGIRGELKAVMDSNKKGSSY